MTSRRHIAFRCEGSACVGTLDPAAGRCGLLIVTGGNELRAGAWNGQAHLAARVAAAGFPVFRFDRRGVGDSEGANAGFQGSAADIAAAIAAFRAEMPQLRTIVAFGNCDAATALVLAEGAGCDALVLSNPWTIEASDQRPLPPAAIRAHYARRLRNPAALLRALTGRVSIRGLVRSLWQMRQQAAPTALGETFKSGLGRFAGPVTLLLAERDRTGQVFLAGWDETDPRLQLCPGATHSYVEPEAQLWLERQILAMLERVAA